MCYKPGHFINSQHVKHILLDKDYHGKEMSDGERVALYAMGQCLCAPTGSILIIDEPELHLHSSIMQSLWDKLEEAQKTACSFTSRMISILHLLA